jgi:hypothetical protein
MAYPMKFDVTVDVILVRTVLFRYHKAAAQLPRSIAGAAIYSMRPRWPYNMVEF